jgi:cytochrome c556
MSKTFVVAALTVTLGAAFAAETFAQEKPENYIRFRKATQQVTIWHNRQLGAVAKGQRPMDAAEVARAAQVIATLAPVFATAFPAGTDQGDTRARPEIWSQPDKFKQLMDRYVAESAKLVDVAKAGNSDAIKSQIGTLAKACDACHDDFRKK